MSGPRFQMVLGAQMVLEAQMVLGAILVLAAVSLAPMPLAAQQTEPLKPDDVRKAIEKSLTLIEGSTAEYRSQRKCFACHHLAIPTFTLLEARQRQFTVDAENLRKQVEHTRDFLQSGRASYLEGRGQGGKADTAGYALWTLEAAEAPADETTAAVVGYLLEWQKQDDHWSCTSHRPPSEASHITTTYLAARAVRAYGGEDQRERIAQRTEQVLKWLESVKPVDTEDHVFRLRALALLEADAKHVADAVQQLIQRQRDDGGWSQTETLESDAYATGSALVALHEYGGLSVDDPQYQRGARFLLSSQLPDGSWHVVSRSKPFQTYFESGFPHGKDQFISMAASSWATTALLLLCPLEAASSAAEK